MTIFPNRRKITEFTPVNVTIGWMLPLRSSNTWFIRATDKKVFLQQCHMGHARIVCCLFESLASAGLSFFTPRSSWPHWTIWLFACHLVFRSFLHRHPWCLHLARHLAWSIPDRRHMHQGSRKNNPTKRKDSQRIGFVSCHKDMHFVCFSYFRAHAQGPLSAPRVGLKFF